nr:hypothetical protein [Streptomyces sp. SID4951]
MLVRRLGTPEARRIAAAGTLEDALRGLATTPYFRQPASGISLPAAQRAVTATLLWHLRVLAGWLPRRGVECLRMLASGFEIANIEAHFRRLSGSGAEPPPYPLGALATVWSRLARTPDPEALRAALIASPWRDSGGTAAAMAVTLRLTAAARTAARIPPAVRWSAGRAALLVARERFVHDRPLPATAIGPAVGVLGTAVHAPTYRDYRRRLPAAAGWALHGIDGPADLWQAEGRWWRDVEQEGRRMARRARYDMVPVVGAVAVLSTDAWRTRAVLELAADASAPPEDFDALV